MKTKDREGLLRTLQDRFEKNTHRHEGITWDAVQDALAKSAARLRSLSAMEATGGEPDVVGRDPETGRYWFYDCSPESPTGRRSTAYDKDARESRKEARPANSAVEMAAAMGVELLDEDQYRALQRLGEFDLKTSSWVKTPDDVRALGGALFCDRRYGKVFVYHNGAQSYYAARGWRGALLV
ncbi:MAG: DUF4256 domain-containing protein [Polyangiaceae bacterium]